MTHIVSTGQQKVNFNSRNFCIAMFRFGQICNNQFWSVSNINRFTFLYEEMHENDFSFSFPVTKSLTTAYFSIDLKPHLDLRYRRYSGCECTWLVHTAPVCCSDQYFVIVHSQLVSFDAPVRERHADLRFLSFTRDAKFTVSTTECINDVWIQRRPRCSDRPLVDGFIRFRSYRCESAETRSHTGSLWPRDADVSMKTSQKDSVCLLCHAAPAQKYSWSVLRPLLQSLVVSVVLSRLDYCNVTLAGIPSYQLKRL